MFLNSIWYICLHTIWHLWHSISYFTWHHTWHSIRSIFWHDFDILPGIPVQLHQVHRTLWNIPFRNGTSMKSTTEAKYLGYPWLNCCIYAGPSTINSWRSGTKYEEHTWRFIKIFFWHMILDIQNICVGIRALFCATIW